MKRFRFRLERLERLRDQQERTARIALAERLANERRVVEGIERVTSDLEACANADERAAPLARALEGGLRRNLRRLEHERKLAEAAVAAARRGWEIARREVRTLEKLRERRFEEWRVAARRAEAMEMDEIARVRFVTAATEKQRVARRRADEAAVVSHGMEGTL